MRKEVDVVVLDYGNVISLPQRTELLDRIRRELECDGSKFEALYASQRRRLDSGELDLKEYWRATLEAYGYPAEGDRVERFARLDMDSWSAINQRMVAWIRHLRDSGVRTFLLSNMPTDFYESVVSDSFWYALFDGAVISGCIGMVKPDREIFQYLLRKTETEAGRTLFLDDMEKNVAAARKAGIEGVLFRSAETTIPSVASAYGLPLDTENGSVDNGSVDNGASA